jgi:hypothetical protein
MVQLRDAYHEHDGYCSALLAMLLSEACAYEPGWRVSRGRPAAREIAILFGEASGWVPASWNGCDQLVEVAFCFPPPTRLLRSLVEYRVSCQLPHLNSTNTVRHDATLAQRWTSVPRRVSSAEIPHASSPHIHNTVRPQRYRAFSLVRSLAQSLGADPLGNFNLGGNDELFCSGPIDLHYW